MARSENSPDFQYILQGRLCRFDFIFPRQIHIYALSYLNQSNGVPWTGSVTRIKLCILTFLRELSIRVVSDFCNLNVSGVFPCFFFFVCVCFSRWNCGTQYFTPLVSAIEEQIPTYNIFQSEFNCINVIPLCTRAMFTQLVFNFHKTRIKKKY